MTWSCHSRPTSTTSAPIPITATHLRRRCSSGSAGPLPEPGPEDCRISTRASASWRQPLERGVALAMGARERGVDPPEHPPHQRAGDRRRDGRERDVLELDRQRGGRHAIDDADHQREHAGDQRDERRERDRQRGAAHQDALLHRAGDQRGQPEHEREQPGRRARDQIDQVAQDHRAADRRRHVAARGQPEVRGGQRAEIGGRIADPRQEPPHRRDRDAQEIRDEDERRRPHSGLAPNAGSLRRRDRASGSGGGGGASSTITARTRDTSTVGSTSTLWNMPSSPMIFDTLPTTSPAGKLAPRPLVTTSSPTLTLASVPARVRPWRSSHSILHAYESGRPSPTSRPRAPVGPLDAAAPLDAPAAFGALAPCGAVIPGPPAPLGAAPAPSAPAPPGSAPPLAAAACAGSRSTTSIRDDG